MPVKKPNISKVKDPWKLLNIKQGSDPKALKVAFQKAAMKHHPDAGGDTKSFMEVQKAYEAVQQLEHIARRSTTGDLNSASARQGKEASLRYKSPRKARNSKSWAYLDKWKYENGKVVPSKENVINDAKSRTFYDLARNVEAVFPSLSVPLLLIVFGILLVLDYYADEIKLPERDRRSLI
eukprot:TRINITY_DN651_c10_g1_i1.p1 TRINITY_DN651_c10_g1~~TRINITY_DN651_c10_g1_i1.p1  ORF type:complete len:180 (+),score=27.66 TRINITY_DN651_c10_g1_i1:78-617(+)